MGLFSSKKNNNQPVVQDDNYFAPVEEIEGGIPVGRIEPEVKEPKATEIIFDDAPSSEENKPAFNDEDLHNPIEDFMAMVQPPMMQQQMPQQPPMMNNNYQQPVQQPMPMQQPMAPQMPYDPNYCFIRTAAPKEDIKEEPIVQNEVTNQFEERAEKTSKFFSGDAPKEEETYFKKKEKVAPITGTTSIFNIGMIPSQNNNEDKRL